MKSISTILLFPHQTSAQLTDQAMKVKTLRILKFLMTESISAVKAFFIDNILSLFDPHVGDTLCQIRAYKNLLIWMRFTSKRLTFDVLVELKHLYSMLEAIERKIAFFEQEIRQKKSVYNKLLDATEALPVFLERHALMFKMPALVFYLLQNKILTQYSIKNNGCLRIGIDYKRMAQDLGTGKSFAKNLVDYFQVNLTKDSCEFIRELIEELGEKGKLSTLLLWLEQADRVKRRVLPCYEVTKILLAHLAMSQCPILLVAYRAAGWEEDAVVLMFHFCRYRNDFVVKSEFAAADLKSPCFVINGKTVYAANERLESAKDFTQRIMAIGLVTIMLANMAIHPQYSAQELRAWAANPYQMLLDAPATNMVQASDVDYDIYRLLLSQRAQTLAYLQSVAKLSGCWQGKPTLFCVQHIYPAILEEVWG